MTTGRSTTTVPSPIGPLTLAAVDGVLCGVYMAEHRHAPAFDTLGERDDDILAEAVRQLDAYFAGELTAFDVPTAPVIGTPFQQRVWAALAEIGYGQTASYGDLARAIGQPTASRAVGMANGRNPLSILVPCHRVIGSDGKIVGYGGGADRKRFLLDFERSTLAARLQPTGLVRDRVVVRS